MGPSPIAPNEVKRIGVEFLVSAGRIMGKIVLWVASVWIAYVYFDNWNARRVEVDIFPQAVSVYDRLVNETLFDLSPNDLQAFLNWDRFGGLGPKSEQFGVGAAWAQLRAVLEGNWSAVNKVTLSALQTMIALADHSIRVDSVAAYGPEVLISDSKRDSLRHVVDAHKRLRNRLALVRDRYADSLSANICLSVKLTFANLSDKQTSISDPGLLRVHFEQHLIEAPLRLVGKNIEFEMLGMRVLGGEIPQRVIPAQSYETIEFITETRRALGDEWAKLETAFERSGGEAKVLLYTVSGEVVESPWFPFSPDFANARMDERLQHLKAVDRTAAITRTQ